MVSGPLQYLQISKCFFFDNELPDASFDISIFVETHHKGEDNFPDLINEYKTTHNILHTPTPPYHTHSGIIVLIRKNIEIISHCVKIAGRLMNVHFKDVTEDKILFQSHRLLRK